MPGPEHFREAFSNFDPDTATNVKVYGVPVRSRVLRCVPDRHGRTWVTVTPTGRRGLSFTWEAAMNLANASASKERERIFAIWLGGRR